MDICIHVLKLKLDYIGVRIRLVEKKFKPTNNSSTHFFQTPWNIYQKNTKRENYNEKKDY